MYFDAVKRKTQHCYKHAEVLHSMTVIQWFTSTLSRQLTLPRKRSSRALSLHPSPHLLYLFRCLHIMHWQKSSCAQTIESAVWRHLKTLFLPIHGRSPDLFIHLKLVRWVYQLHSNRGSDESGKRDILNLWRIKILLQVNASLLTFRSGKSAVPLYIALAAGPVIT